MSDDMKHDSSTKRTLQIDVAKYQAMLDAPGATEEEKREFLEALWQVIVAFVDLGFEVHPVQLACGQVENAAPENHDAAPNMVGSPQQPTSEFEAAAKAEGNGRA